ncbi:transporter associated domain-containing protein, partial [uncultured Bilophila sp.]
LGYHIPKGYLYAAIGFSIVVEAFNQLALRNRRNRITTRGLRESAARAVLELLGGTTIPGGETEMEMAALGYSDCRDKVFRPEERAIVARVIRFGGRTVRYIMTPRHKVQWLDSNESPEALLKLVGASKHAFLPVMCGDTDEVLGVVDLRELLWRYQKTGRFSLEASVVPVPMVFEHTGLPDVLDAFRQHPAPMGIVLDEYGSAVGVVTPMDILSAIAGHMGDVAPEPDSFRQPDGSWLLPGRMAVDEGLHTLGIQPEEELSCATMAGLLLERLGHIPAAGESLFFWGHLWTVASMDGLRIDQIRIHPQRSGDITEKSE